MATLFKNNRYELARCRTVFALARARSTLVFAASRQNMQGVKFKKFTMRDQPDGSQIDEAVVEAR